MKKVFTLLVAIIVCHSVFATATSSGNWRWRNDDGNGDSSTKSGAATWMAPENTSITLTSTSKHVRIRIVNYSNSQTGTGTPQIAYSTSLNGVYTVVPTNALLAFQMVASPYVADGTSSPEQLSNTTTTTPNPSYTSTDPFGAGVIYTTNNGASGTITTDTKNEAEYNIVPTTNVSPSTTYYFRQYASGQTPGTVLSGVPTLTTSAAILPVTFTDFNVVVDVNGNESITWVTATENNSANYVIESSIDGTSFSALATVASKNIATGASYAYTYSKSLPQGVNYFRLKAVDKDGSSMYSGIKAVNITSGISKITIAPNPVVNTLNITGVQNGSTVQLYNINAQKILTAVATGSSLQQVNVSTLTHGAYYVQVVTAGKVVANQLIIKQ